MCACVYLFVHILYKFTTRRTGVCVYAVEISIYLCALFKVSLSVVPANAPLLMVISGGVMALTCARRVRKQKPLVCLCVCVSLSRLMLAMCSVFIVGVPNDTILYTTHTHTRYI